MHPCVYKVTKFPADMPDMPSRNTSDAGEPAAEVASDLPEQRADQEQVLNNISDNSEIIENDGIQIVNEEIGQGETPPSVTSIPAFQQLIQALKSPSSPNQQEEVLQILKNNPLVMAEFLKKRQLQLIDNDSKE